MFKLHDQKLEYREPQFKALLFAIAMMFFTLVMVLAFDDFNEQTRLVYSYVAVVELLLSIIVWYIVYPEWLSPIPIIIFSLYLFNLGYCVLWIQGISTNQEIQSLEIIIKAQKYLLLCMNFFYIGCISVRRRKQKTIYNNHFSQYDLSRVSLKKTAVLVMIVSAVPYVYNLSRMLISSLTRGYAFIYSVEYQTSTSSLIGVVGNLFEPALLGLIVAIGDNKKKRPLILLSFGIVAVHFLIGGRANGVAMAIALLLLLYFEDKKLTLKRLVVIIILGYILLTFIAATKMIRLSENRSVIDYLIAFTSTNDVLNEVFREFGGSISPLLYTINLVPAQYPFRYGYTYLFAIISVVPNLGFWTVHPAEKYAALSAWVTAAANHSWSGLGFSSTAEAFINFSWLGCIVFFFWGYVITKVIYKCKDSNSISPLYLFIILSVFLCLFYSFTRGDFRDMVRSFSWRILPIIILYLVIFQSNKRKVRGK